MSTSSTGERLIRDLRRLRHPLQHDIANPRPTRLVESGEVTKYLAEATKVVNNKNQQKGIRQRTLHNKTRVEKLIGQ